MVTYQCGHKKPVSAYKSGQCADCQHKANKQRKGRPRGDNRPKMDDKGRLPHNSSFYVNFDAAKVAWTGTLTIWEPRREFSGTASGVEGLLRQLAHQFRDSLKEES